MALVYVQPVIFAGLYSDLEMAFGASTKICYMSHPKAQKEPYPSPRRVGSKMQGLIKQNHYTASASETLQGTLSITSFPHAILSFTLA